MSAPNDAALTRPFALTAALTRPSVSLLTLPCVCCSRFMLVPPSFCAGMQSLILVYTPLPSRDSHPAPLLSNRYPARPHVALCVPHELCDRARAFSVPAHLAAHPSLVHKIRLNPEERSMQRDNAASSTVFRLKSLYPPAHCRLLSTPRNALSCACGMFFATPFVRTSTAITIPPPPFAPVVSPRCYLAPTLHCVAPQHRCFVPPPRHLVSACAAWRVPSLLRPCADRPTTAYTTPNMSSALTHPPFRVYFVHCAAVLHWRRSASAPAPCTAHALRCVVFAHRRTISRHDRAMTVLARPRIAPAPRLTLSTPRWAVCAPPCRLRLRAPPCPLDASQSWCRARPAPLPLAPHLSRPVSRAAPQFRGCGSQRTTVSPIPPLAVLTHLVPSPHPHMPSSAVSPPSTNVLCPHAALSRSLTIYAPLPPCLAPYAYPPPSLAPALLRRCLAFVPPLVLSPVPAFSHTHPPSSLPRPRPPFRTHSLPSPAPMPPLLSRAPTAISRAQITVSRACTADLRVPSFHAHQPAPLPVAL
ncbi:hypothetical protein DENSPDRAFT_887046, partial [Dentipellis sp. KUC8613]